MNLFIDMQGAQTSGSSKRGIGRFSRDLVNALSRHTTALSTLYLSWNHTLTSPIDDLDVPSFQSNQPALISAPYGTLPRNRFAFDLHDLQQDINSRLFTNALAISGCDHVLFTSLMEADEPDFMLPKHLNFAPLATSYSIVYDIIPWLFKERYLATSALQTRYNSHLAVKTSANIIFTISEYTRNDLIRVIGITPERVVNIGAGIDQTLFHTNGGNGHNLRSRLGLKKPFLLFLGGDEFRKNITGFVAAMAALSPARRTNLQALLLGKVSPEKMAELREICFTAGLADNTLIFQDYLPHDELMQAYKACAMTVIPSIYEGFGLPVLEAMACGAAVIASAHSSMAEIIQNDDFLFNANDPDDIACRIEFVLTEEIEVRRFQNSYQGILDCYTWEAVAQRVVATMESMALCKDNATIASGSFYQPQHVAVAFLNSPDKACQEVVATLAQHNDVKVYYQTACPDVDALPVSTDTISNLWKHLEIDTPVFFFSNTIEDLTIFASRYPVSNVIAITDDPRAVEWQPHPSDIISAFYAVWNRQGHEVSTLRSASLCPTMSRPILNAIAHALQSYRFASTRVLAHDLGSLLKKEGRMAKYAKKISQEAATAKFDAFPVHPKSEI